MPGAGRATAAGKFPLSLSREPVATLVQVALDEDGVAIFVLFTFEQVALLVGEPLFPR